MKTYYSYLDTLKGIAILLMVMAHALSWSYPESHFLTGDMQKMTTEEFYSTIVWKVIYSFHMPLLFFASGFLFYKEGIATTINTCYRIIAKRVQRLLIPYITTGVFVLFLRGYFGYWFFIVLFILNVIVLIELLIEEKLRLKAKGEIVGHLVTFVLLTLMAKVYRNYLFQEIIQLGTLPQYYLVFIFGYIIHKYNKINAFFSNSKVSFISFITYVVLMIIVKYYGLLSVIGALVPLCAIIFLYNYSKGLQKSKVLGGVNIIGKYSMEIYVFHLFFVMAIPEMGNYILSLSNFPLSITLQIVYSFALSIIAIILSIGCSNILKSNKYLSKMLFGA